jgi:translation elongation factor EF-1beta
LVYSLAKNPFAVQFDLHTYSFMVRLCKEAKYTVEIFHPDFGFKVKKIRKRAHTDETETETKNIEIEIQSIESVANYSCGSADENNGYFKISHVSIRGP